MRPGNAARTNTPTASSGSIFQKEPTCRVTRKPTSIKLPMFSTRVHARNSASVLRKRFISLLCSLILPLKVLHFRVETAVDYCGELDGLLDRQVPQVRASASQSARDRPSNP